VRYVHQSHGWEIGVGPTVVVVNEGVAKNLSTSTLKDDAYASIFDRQGLMAGISIEGTKTPKSNDRPTQDGHIFCPFPPVCHYWTTLGMNWLPQPWSTQPLRHDPAGESTCL
jgi:hypothetical protein